MSIPYGEMLGEGNAVDKNLLHHFVLGASLSMFAFQRE